MFDQQPLTLFNCPSQYTACANPYGDIRGDWCPTELIDGMYISGSGKWGLCDVDLPECTEAGGVC